MAQHVRELFIHGYKGIHELKLEQLNSINSVRVRIMYGGRAVKKQFMLRKILDWSYDNEQYYNM